MKRSTTKRNGGGTNADLLNVWEQIDGEEVVRSSNFWKPERVGDMLVGFYAGKHDGGKDEDGKDMGPVADIKTVDGIVPVGLNAVLSSLLTADLVGKYVAIQHHREIPRPGKPNPLRDFRVKVLSADEAAELSALVNG